MAAQLSTHLYHCYPQLTPSKQAGRESGIPRYSHMTVILRRCHKMPSLWSCVCCSDPFQADTPTKLTALSRTLLCPSVHKVFLNGESSTCAQQKLKLVPELCTVFHPSLELSIWVGSLGGLIKVLHQVRHICKRIRKHQFLAQQLLYTILSNLQFLAGAIANISSSVLKIPPIMPSN